MFSAGIACRRPAFSSSYRMPSVKELSVNRFLIYDIPSWLHEYQTVIGCVIIGVSTICLALAGILKSKGDKATPSRKKDGNAQSKRYYIQYAIALLVCCGWTGYGTWLTKHAGDQAAEHAEQIQRDTNEKIAKIGLEFREKIQAVLVKLNAAKQEESQKITEEKIRALKNDFSQWAEDFATNMPTEKSKFAQLKIALQKKQAEETDKEIQRQKQESGQLYPVYSSAIKFLQESVRAFASKTGNTNILIDPLELPENLYGKQISGNIHFTNAVWNLSILAGWTSYTPYQAGYDVNKPFLKITFGSQEEFYLRINEQGNKMTIVYRTSLPTPNPENINGEYDLSDYESVLKSDLQRIIKAQLLQLEN